MRIPVECPVCGAKHIEPIQRQTLMTQEDGSKTVTDTVAFRCGRGHTFLVSEAGPPGHLKNGDNVDA